MPLTKNGHIESPPLSEHQWVDAYVALYHKLLESPGKIVLDELETAHRRIDSSLHRSSGSKGVNLSAFVYAAERLPPCLPLVKRIIIAPTEKVFVECGYGHVLDWERDGAHRRRRRAHFDGRDILAIFANSISDFDDLVPSLCAYQIEWNAMHRRLHASALGQAVAAGRMRASETAEEIRRLFGANTGDWGLFLRLWPDEWDMHLKAIADAPKKMIVERLPLRRGDFERSAAEWIDAVMNHFPDIDGETRPAYIVSSNTHSMANLISGYAFEHADEIIADALDEVIDDDDDYLRGYWRRLKYEDESLRRDFLYYALRAFLKRHPDRIPEKIAQEESVGLRRFTPDHLLHLEAQIIELHKIDPRRLDPCLGIWPTASAAGGIPSRRGRHRQGEALRHDGRQKDGAVVFNIDYPLGFSAYYVMKMILTRMKRVRGVFILGKSAAMIGRLGDIMIPEEVRDAHSGNLYRFRNVFSAGTIVPYLAETAVFDEQRTLTVRGTFLHSRYTVRDFRGADFTGIEMEAGPYLSALDEHLSGATARKSAVIAIAPAFPVGILHYTSDTPYNLRASLLSRRMGLTGLEATYACSRAILDAIRQGSGLHS
ncbi:MAG: hypothetical protein JW943_14205 [Deltaproteobacteria bacterium]|nr:hypothetical protein [Deltaproteobacteria bacterium]